MDTLILTYHRNYYGGALHGILQANKSFHSIEFVEFGLHAYKTLKRTSPEVTKQHLSLLSSDELSLRVLQHNNSTASNQDIVTVYIKFYYTKLFYESTDDVNGFLDQLISQLNLLLQVNDSMNTF